MRSIAVLCGSAGKAGKRQAHEIAPADFGPHPQLAVRGLIFDMGGVLYDATLWRRWLLQLLARMGHTFRYHSFCHVWDSEYLVDVHRGRREYGEAFQAFLLSQGLTWAQIDEVEAASRVRQQELESGQRPLPGVVPTVDALAQRGFRMAVLTDSLLPAGQLHEQLDRLGLGGCFEAAISSCDLEAVKPDPIGYQAALEALDLTAADAALVGHTAHDLSGAAAVGLRTIAVNHDSDAQAAVYLTRFADLLPLVALPAQDLVPRLRRLRLGTPCHAGSAGA